MRKILVYVFLFFVIVLKVNATSGRRVSPPLFKVMHDYTYYLKAKVIEKKVWYDSSFGYHTINLVLLVKENFKKNIGDTIIVNTIRYKKDEIYQDGFENIFMDLQLNSIYYFGLDSNLSLSPYVLYNKVKLGYYVQYSCFSQLDFFLFRRFRNYKGRKMEVSKFERKIKRKLKTES